MTSMQSLFDWLLTLPSGTLYVVLAVTAGIENVIPPFPSDVIVAFGSFVAAQGDETMLGVFLSVWFGNVSTALLLYAAGRRYGANRLERRLAGKQAESVDAKLRTLFQKYGMPALFVSRFIPGVRAVVPAFAGALRLSVGWTALMIATASAIWYGLITVIAFRVGSDWEQLRETVTRYSTVMGIAAAVIFGLGVGAWVFVRRQRKT
jgi:membrane protein DedA with SNARE-associated domain